MRIVEIRELTVPLRGAVANSVVSFEHHTVSLVAVITDVMRGGRPLTGIAFDSIGRFAQRGILTERMIPRILGAEPDSLTDPDSGLLDPALVLSRSMTDEKPGGHGDRAAAAAAIELAVWDLLAKADEQPAHAYIARRFGRPIADGGVDTYAAGGYYHSGDSKTLLAEEISGYVDAGYRAAKIKIGGAPLLDDLARVEAAIEVLGSGGALAVDANGRFDRARAVEYAQALDPYALRWYEEPVDPLDYGLHAELAQLYSRPLATGENLFSLPDVRNLLSFGGLRPGHDILQMDAGLSYGLTEYARMIDLMESRGFDRRDARPHGGHLINLHIVAGLGLGGCEAYPGVFEPFGGYGPACAVVDGRLWPDDAPGFGLERKPGLAEPIAELTA